MILTVSMKSHRRLKARESGLKPDFRTMFEADRGIRLVSIVDNGRSAKVDVDKGVLSVLERKYSGDFIFSPNIKIETF